MSKAIVSTVRRAFPLALVLTLAVLFTAACTGDDGDADGLTDGLSDGTPTTTLPATTAPTATVATGVSPTVETGDGGGATAVTLEDVQAYAMSVMPTMSADDLTAVDFVDGAMTIETSWDSTMEADAQTLCEDMLMMTTDPPVASVTINGSDGASLAEC